MPPNDAQTQADTEPEAVRDEPLTEQVVVKITKSEKAAIVLLKAHGHGSESEIVRSHAAMTAIRDRANRIRDAVSAAGESAA